MSSWIDDYLNQGLSEIFRVAYENREEAGGFQDEHTTETIVAKSREGSFVRVDTEEHLRFGPRAKPRRKQSRAEISEEEYRHFSAGKSRLDTDAAQQGYARRKADDERRQLAKAELLKHDHRCPMHRTKLQLRTGMYGPYWACSKAGCKTTKNFNNQERQIFEKTKL